MQYKRWHTHLLAVFFTFLFSCCTVGFYVTGWDMSLASDRWLLVWCGLYSVLIPLFMYFRYGMWCILGLALVSGLVLWQGGVLWEQIQSFVGTISSHYEKVYGWSSIGSMITDEYDLVMHVMVFLIAFSVSWCICYEISFAWCASGVLIPLMLCLFTTDTLPDTPILLLFIFGFVMMLLTDWTRRKNPEKYPALTLKILVPVAAAAILLFALNPQEAYVNRAAQLQKEAVQLAQKVQSVAESVAEGSFTDSIGSERLNLRSAGPKSELTYSVMRVTSPCTGTVYLRGRDYDVYTGTAWEASEARVETMPVSHNSIGTMSITTYSVRDVLYVPYGITDNVKLIGGRAENSENLKSYSYTIANTPWSSPEAYGYTALPEKTVEWAGPIVWTLLAESPAGTSVEQKVQILGSYVRNSAVYDTSTSSMGGGYDDFAQWFLEESDTGYCVHFATAAAVLLRAAGIPARYVEGYAVNCQADETTLVTNQSAHAWVEYYDKAQGRWNILEATPGEALLDGEILSEDDDPAETNEQAETDEEGTDTVTTETEEETASVDGYSPTYAPQGSGGDGSRQDSHSATTDPQKEPFIVPKWIKILGAALLCAAFIPGTGDLRIYLQRKRWNSGTANEMALIRWKQSRYMAKRMKVILPDELEELALKAKFSQHTITEGELERFALFRKLVLEEVDRMPWYRRWFFRWIYAIG